MLLHRYLKQRHPGAFDRQGVVGRPHRRQLGGFASAALVAFVMGAAQGFRI